MSEALSGTELSLPRRMRPFQRRRRPAVLASLILHSVILLLLLIHFAPEELPRGITFLPVELVTLAEPQRAPDVPSPPQRRTAPLRPQTRSPAPERTPLPLPQQTPATPDRGDEPVPLPPKDELQSRLEAFARLNLPGSGGIAGSGIGLSTGSRPYDVKDFVRAQVERRWNVDVAALANHDVTVAIHVVLTREGAIRKAEIVNDRRSDPEWHSLALSARNAVILASPIAIPADTPGSALDMVLTLSPKDTLK